MELEAFASKVSEKFGEKHDIDKRMVFAAQIAEAYRFKCPELILFFTHPTLSRLPVGQRCIRLGISEEEYLVFSTQDGFKRFMRDYQTTMIDTVRAQSLSSVGDALEKDRYKYDKFGNEMANHDLEIEVLRGMSEERKGPQVAVQVNNLWGQARQQMTGKKP